MKSIYSSVTPSETPTVFRTSVITGLLLLFGMVTVPIVIAAPTMPLPDSDSEKALSQNTPTPSRTTSTRNAYEPRQFVFEGQLEEGIDRTWSIVQEIPLASRLKVAQAHKIPLKRVPSEHTRRIVRAPNGPSDEDIRRHLHKQVRVIAIRDRSAHFYLLRIQDL